jgi:deoxyribose-phosphate aldolase
VKLATVVGFPFGYHSAEVKGEETRIAIGEGADEIDMVINVGALKNGNKDILLSEVRKVLQPVRSNNKLIKVIIESGILTNDEIAFCCGLYAGEEVDFLKTSTGFAEKGASVEHVQLMRRLLPSSIRIKASGGIRDLNFARQLVEAGASRLGCSASVAIVKEEANGAS